MAWWVNFAWCPEKASDELSEIPTMPFGIYVEFPALTVRWFVSANERTLPAGSDIPVSFGTDPIQDPLSASA